MRFGDCLVELLRKYGWNRAELVKALEQDGVHPSLAYRWFRNERTPKLNSGDRERIAACLGLHVEDVQLLRDAQVESLQRVSDAVHGDSQGSVCLNIMNAQRVPITPTFFAPPPGLCGAPALSTTSILRGREAVRDVAASLLQAAPPPETLPPGNREILTTALTDGTIDAPLGLVGWLTPEFCSALRRGFTVSHLLTRNATSVRSVRMVHAILQLVGAGGSYQPRHFGQYETLVSPWEMLIVPQTGAMMIFATEQPNTADAALLIRDLQQIEALRACYALVKAQTKPLMNTYLSGEDSLAFLETMLAIERKEGDCFLTKHGLSSHTVPHSWYKEGSNWARVNRVFNVDHNVFLELKKQRLDAFYRRVENYRYCEMCSRSAIIRMVRNGGTSMYGPYPYIGPRDRIEQFQNVIALLSSFDKYELALLNEVEECDYMPPNFCQVKRDIKGNHAVIFEMWSQLDAEPTMELGSEILESDMCDAFYYHFLRLFDNKISRGSKDKREVRLFLEAQISWLKEHLDQDSGPREVT